MVSAVSPVYRTEPQGLKDQPWFANQVARIACEPGWRDNPEQFLRELLSIEERMGRTQAVRRGALRFGPRIIDLDLLFIDGVVLHTPTVTLPHPRMRERAFVLVPLHDIAPDLTFGDGETVARALARLAHVRDGQTIRQD